MMKRFFGLLFLGVLAFVSSCSSDSDSFTAEERELRNLFNNEWRTVEFKKLFVDGENGNLHSTEFIEDLFNTITFPIDASNRLIMGMNKKGEVYSWHNVEGYGTLLNFSYACVSQAGNKFTGYFNGITSKNQVRDLYIRQIDQETMKMVVVYEKEFPQADAVPVEVNILKKIGPWDEKMSVKKIFEIHEYSAEDIESFGAENYEREHGQGNCL